MVAGKFLLLLLELSSTLQNMRNNDLYEHGGLTQHYSIPSTLRKIF